MSPIERKVGSCIYRLTSILRFCSSNWDALRDLVTFFTIQKTWKTRIEECLLKLKPEVRLTPATLLKVALPHACFPRFIHCTNGTELHKVCNFIKKETLAQVFSCEFCKISNNTFSYRTPPVAVSTKLRICNSIFIALRNFQGIVFI